MINGAGKELDALLGLRVFATVLVVFGHAASSFQVYSFTQWPQFPYVQSIAVVIFFCVSGFTIAWVCDTRKDIGTGAFGRFAYDRFMRLIIPLVPTLLLFGALEPFLFGESHPYIDSLTFWDAFGNALLLQNMAFPGFGPIPEFSFGIQAFGLNRPLWTLSIEFWLYVAFGALFFLRSASGRHRALLALVFAVAFLLLLPFVDNRHGAGLPVIWALSAGLYFLVKRLAEVGWRRRLIVLPFWIFAFACLFQPEFWGKAEYGKYFMLIIFANFAGFILVVPGLHLPRPLGRIVLFLSGFCYTVYLTHYPIMYVSRAWVPPTELGAWFVVGACFVFGWLFSLPFEARYKKIRDVVWDRISGLRS